MIVFIFIFLLIIYWLVDLSVNYHNYHKFKNKFPKNILPPLEEIKLPEPKSGNNTPRVLHRTYISEEKASVYYRARKITLDNNPGLEEKFYSDQDVDDYIKKNFSDRIYRAYNSINPIYGPAKADFFRYLVIYLEGGLYLDIKSVAKKNLSSLFEQNKLIISKGREKKFLRSDFGLRATLSNNFNWSSFSGIECGEYNNWHFMAPPGNKILAKVIQQMISNIEYGKKYTSEYTYGEYSVLVLTGPIMFSRVIEKYKDDSLIIMEPEYNKMVSYRIEDHKTNGNHYSTLKDKRLII